MINLITTSLMVTPEFDNPFGAVLIIIFIVVIAFTCFGEDTKPKTKNTYRPPKTSRSYTFENDYPDYSDYDPSWDDAWFDKTGQDPWFDDNKK